MSYAKWRIFKGFQLCCSYEVAPEENGREPMQADVLYDRELKARFGPWNRMLERAGTRPVAQSYLDKQQRRREKRARHKEYRRQIREQQAAEAEQGASAATEAAIHQ